MLMVGAESIRDVIAFPKTQSALCLLSEAPGSVPDDSLESFISKKLRSSYGRTFQMGKY